MTEDLKVRDSSGNVFRDMDMPDAEARLAKAELARLVRKMVRHSETETIERALEMVGFGARPASSNTPPWAG